MLRVHDRGTPHTRHLSLPTTTTYPPPPPAHHHLSLSLSPLIPYTSLVFFAMRFAPPLCPPTRRSPSMRRRCRIPRAQLSAVMLASATLHHTKGFGGEADTLATSARRCVVQHSQATSQAKPQAQAQPSSPAPLTTHHSPHTHHHSSPSLLTTHSTSTSTHHHSTLRASSSPTSAAPSARPRTLFSTSSATQSWPRRRRGRRVPRVAVAAAWRGGSRAVLECLQRALKIADACKVRAAPCRVGVARTHAEQSRPYLHSLTPPPSLPPSLHTLTDTPLGCFVCCLALPAPQVASMHTPLFVETLDTYLLHFGNGVTSVTPKYACSRPPHPPPPLHPATRPHIARPLSSAPQSASMPLQLSHSLSDTHTLALSFCAARAYTQVHHLPHTAHRAAASGGGRGRDGRRQGAVDAGAQPLRGDQGVHRAQEDDRREVCGDRGVVSGVEGRRGRKERKGMRGGGDGREWRCVCRVRRSAVRCDRGAAKSGCDCAQTVIR